MTTDLVLTNAEKHLTLYKGMCRAIGACHRVDECKDIADKSIALAAYYKQIKDDETVRKFNEVKLRAWRRIGKLFAAVDLSERETWVAKYKTIRAAFDGAAIAGIDDNRIREILTLMTISDYDFEYALGQSAAGSIASLLQYSPEYQEMLREMQRKEQARTRMTNEELLDIDELMQRGTNQARQLRAYALWDAAKLERQQGNRELADRLKSAGNRLVHKNFQANNPPERKLAALTAMAETTQSGPCMRTLQGPRIFRPHHQRPGRRGYRCSRTVAVHTRGRVEADPRHRTGIDGGDQALSRAFSSDPCRGQPGWLKKPSSTSTSRPRRSP